MNSLIKIKKGYNIKLEGLVGKDIRTYTPDICAVCPTDFRYVVPKLLVSEGDLLKIGTPLFYDKNNEKILFCSPVSGEVKQIKRGDKRRIEAIELVNDKQNDSLVYDISNNKDVEGIKDILLSSGLWNVIRQRPYSCIANPKDTPRDIFISCFDTAPLAGNIDFFIKENYDYFKKGLEILKKLTSGKIYLGINSENKSNCLYEDLASNDIVVNQFEGPHPAGNVGIQIHHIKPINKEEIIWYLYPLEVLRIGYLFETGKLNNETIVALTGDEVKDRAYYKTIIGANVSGIIKNNLIDDNVRVISGNVLTGENIGKSGYLNYYHNQISVIAEGDYYEMLGWAMPGLDKLSYSKTFLSSLLPIKKLKVDTNYHGGERAFVVTGYYEKVLPMDILPMQLLKAILAKDIDLMEQLGIYEVDEEDFALCEFICPSKIEIQSILRNGIDLIRNEMI